MMFVETLTDLQYRALLELSALDEGTQLQLRELAERVDGDASELKDAVDKLALDHLVELERSYDDPDSEWYGRRPPQYHADNPLVSVTWLGLKKLSRHQDEQARHRVAHAAVTTPRKRWGWR